MPGRVADYAHITNWKVITAASCMAHSFGILCLRKGQRRGHTENWIVKVSRQLQSLLTYVTKLFRYGRHQHQQLVKYYSSTVCNIEMVIVNYDSVRILDLQLNKCYNRWFYLANQNSYLYKPNLPAMLKKWAIKTISSLQTSLQTEINPVGVRHVTYTASQQSRRRFTGFCV